MCAVDGLVPFDVDVVDDELAPVVVDAGEFVDVDG